MISGGLPGPGKTTIAGIIANSLQVPFYTLSAISSGVKEVREVIAEAREKANAILFIVSPSLNKGQQMPVGGGREGCRYPIGVPRKPFFEVNSALSAAARYMCLKPWMKRTLSSYYITRYSTMRC